MTTSLFVYFVDKSINSNPTRMLASTFLIGGAMKPTIHTAIFLTFVFFSTGVFSDPVKWHLEDVRLEGGAVVEGSFVFDVNTELFTEINISTSDSPGITGRDYGYTNDGGLLFNCHPGICVGFFEAGSEVGALDGQRMLQLVFSDFLGYEDAIVSLASGYYVYPDGSVHYDAGEFICNNNACSGQDQFRGIVSGAVYSGPWRPVFGYLPRYRTYSDEMVENYSHILMARGAFRKASDRYEVYSLIDQTQNESEVIDAIKRKGKKVLFSFGNFDEGTRLETENLLIDCHNDFELCVLTAEEVINHVHDMNYDGIDVDIENFGDFNPFRTSDKEAGYQVFVEILSFYARSDDLMITAAIQIWGVTSYSQYGFDKSVGNYFDYLLLMGYEHKTPRAPEGPYWMTYDAIKYLEGVGIEQSKIVPLMPFYVWIMDPKQDTQDGKISYKEWANGISSNTDIVFGVCKYLNNYLPCEELNWLATYFFKFKLKLTKS